MNYRLKPENVTRAQMKASAKKIREIYFNFKSRLPTTCSNMIDVRAKLMECVIRVQTEVSHPAARLVATAAFEEMLKRAGGPLESPDEAFDKAMGQNKKDKAEGPTAESMAEAIKQMKAHGFPDPRK